LFLQRVNPRKLRFTNDTRLAPQLKLPGVLLCTALV
jgi:hypothetical protein